MIDMGYPCRLGAGVLEFRKKFRFDFHFQTSFQQTHATRRTLLSQSAAHRTTMDANMVGATGFEPDMAQVKVTFTTTENDLQLPESKRQLLVPAGTFAPS